MIKEINFEINNDDNRLISIRYDESTLVYNLKKIHINHSMFSGKTTTTTDANDNIDILITQQGITSFKIHENIKCSDDLVLLIQRVFKSYGINLNYNQTTNDLCVVSVRR